jgi:carbamoyltransferase
MSITVGIHDGYNASAAVIRDGRIELALQEERLTRLKNQADAPSEVLKLIGDAPARVALNGLQVNYGEWPRKGTLLDRVHRMRKAVARRRTLAKLGLKNAEAVEHHTAHAAAAWHTCPWERPLVFTCDGSGDRLSATVSIGGDRIAEISEHDSIGRLYTRVTRHLGMAPLEHEFKVMGLAPYAGTGEKVERVARMFLDLFEFRGVQWRRRKGVPSMCGGPDFFAKLLSGQRFDVLAAGIQRFIEQMLCEWVRRVISETGIRKIACSGGVFLNVKANLAVLEVAEVEDMYVFPSCGNVSNSIGAACHLAARAGDKIQPLRAIYYGEPITNESAGDALENVRGIRARYVADIEGLVAENLAAGRIVARAKGPMEFGARALGNRSILVRADSPTAVRAIHEIKNRDFWVPCAPSVLAERAGDYYVKPKPVSSPYMMFAFRSRPETRAKFGAAQHAWDYTTRPHEVLETHNPDYYRLLKEYEGRTGEGIVLNTSFHLPGEPIVYRAGDAVDAFVRCGLERMALANWWVEKL